MTHAPPVALPHETVRRSRSRRPRTLCMVHNAVGTQNAIAKIAFGSVRHALDAGWRVTVVAQHLDRSLVNEVEWLPLYVPPRLFLLQWLVARSTIQAAMRGRAFDVLHVHQAQVAALADVMQCHFLTRRAFEQDCLEQRRGFGPAAVRAQQLGVLRAEDYYYRRWNPRTRMLFNSERTRQDFHGLYGTPAREAVLPCPSPPLRFVTPEERMAARRALLGPAYDSSRIVVGYLGGLEERKGCRRLIEAVEAEPHLFLLMGGLYSENFVPSHSLRGRCQAVGTLHNAALEQFYAACDVVALPSRYEPFGMVAVEAAARGLPVIATPEVGAIPHLLPFEVATLWHANTPLGPVVREARKRCSGFTDRAARMDASLGEKAYGQYLLSVYEQILEEKKA